MDSLSWKWRDERDLESVWNERKGNDEYNVKQWLKSIKCHEKNNENVMFMKACVEGS